LFSCAAAVDRPRLPRDGTDGDGGGDSPGDVGTGSLPRVLARVARVAAPDTAGPRHAHTGRYVTHTVQNPTRAGPAHRIRCAPCLASPACGSSGIRHGAGSRRSPAVHGPDRVGHPVVLLLIQAPALASHRLGGQAQQPVRTHLRGAALPVPAAGADVDPGRPVLVRGHGTVRGAIARGEHERDQPPAGAVGAPASGVLLRDDQNGPVLAPGDVLLVGDPGPDDLTGIGTIGAAREVLYRGAPS